MKPETQPWMKDAAKLAAAEIEREGCHFPTAHCAVNPRCQEVRDEDAATILKHLAAHAPQQWIPVSERLPEQRTWVAVCVEHDGQRHVAPAFGVIITNDDNRWRWESEFPVIAWQPLPAPPLPAPPVPDTPGEPEGNGCSSSQLLPCGCRFNYCATDRTGPVFWNQFNGVVQCHMCGQTYTPAAPRVPQGEEKQP